jgi:hypothetical protein
LDPDEKRTQRLANNLFQDMFVDLYNLACELAGDHDPHLLTVSIMSLIFLPFEAGRASRHLPGYQPHHEHPTILAQHIISLLQNGISRSGGAEIDNKMSSRPSPLSVVMKSPRQ